MTKLISVWSPKGGTGKTTLSLHLADALHRTAGRVLVYDSDSQKSLSEVYNHASDLGFDVVSSSPTSVSDYDYLVVDYPPTIDGLTKQHKTMLEKSDHVVSPVRASRLDLMSFKSVTKMIDADRLISVLNAYDKRIKDQVEVCNDIASDFVLLSYSSIYSRTINMCKTVFSDSVKNLYGIQKARKEIQVLVELVK